jgi:regulator of protease activity HflC (stomatin/prohibitin superfamily)
MVYYTLKKVTNQSCSYNAPVKMCPTSDNVMVQVDVTVVFNISRPREFCYNLGAMKFDALLAGAVEEGID